MSADHAHEELLMLIRHTWEDIERTKQRQWSESYHLMIAHGAIIGFLVALEHQKTVPLGLRFIFALAIILLTLTGIIIVSNSQDALGRQRKRADDLYEMIDHEKVRKLLAGESPPDRETHPKLYLFMVVGSGVFALIVILGM
jgi:hypothetical protein